LIRNVQEIKEKEESVHSPVRDILKVKSAILILDSTEMTIEAHEEALTEMIVEDREAALTEIDGISVKMMIEEDLLTVTTVIHLPRMKIEPPIGAHLQTDLKALIVILEARVNSVAKIEEYAQVARQGSKMREVVVIETLAQKEALMIEINRDQISGLV
jgi:hypothetical protein